MQAKHISQAGFLGLARSHHDPSRRAHRGGDPGSCVGRFAASDPYGGPGCTETPDWVYGNAGFLNVKRAALRKLAYLNAAERIGDLAVPPGNRLEKLVGDRAGQHSIRINNQFRICFVWTQAGPKDIEIVDYR